MNAINTTNNSRKRKYTDIENADMRGVKSIKDKSGRRHTVNLGVPKLTEIEKNQNYLKKISVKNENMSKISRNLFILSECSLGVKMSNIQKNSR